MLSRVFHILQVYQPLQPGNGTGAVEAADDILTADGLTLQEKIDSLESKIRYAESELLILELMDD